MSTLAEIEAAAAALSPAEKKHLEDFLRELREQADEAHMQGVYRQTGVHPLPKRGGPPVTVELVRQICEEEGI
jgi:hypothetical protein